MAGGEGREAPSGGRTVGALIYHAVGEFVATATVLDDFLSLAPRVGKMDKAGRLASKLAGYQASLPQPDRDVLAAMFERTREESRLLRTEPPDASEGDHAEDDAETPETRALPGPLTPNVIAVLSGLSRDIYLEQHAPQRLPLYLQSLLTTLVAALEMLVGHLFEAHIRAHPGAVEDSVQVSLAELQGYDSLAALFDAKVEEEVDRFRRRSLKDWNVWFQSRMKIKFEAMAPDYSALNEVIQRRNVIVHNDGRVSAQYRSSVGEKSPPLGAQLDVSIDYLNAALEQILVFGSLLAYTSWRSLDPDDAIDKYVGDLTMQLMLAGRWEAVRALCDRSLQLPNHGRAAHHNVFLVNRWLALKRLSGLDAIRKDVQAWDDTALSPVYQMAKAALLDETDRVAVILTRLVAGDDIPMLHVHTWPLLEEFRASPQYAVIVATREASVVSAASTPSEKPPRKSRARSTSSAVGEPQDADGRLVN
jgi:hypothetical protein